MFAIVAINRRRGYAERGNFGLHTWTSHLCIMWPRRVSLRSPTLRQWPCDWHILMAPSRNEYERSREGVREEIVRPLCSLVAKWRCGAVWACTSSWAAGRVISVERLGFDRSDQRKWNLWQSVCPVQLCSTPLGDMGRAGGPK